eukprot:gene3107-2089_t
MSTQVVPKSSHKVNSLLTNPVTAHNKPTKPTSKVVHSKGITIKAPYLKPTTQAKATNTYHKQLHIIHKLVIACNKNIHTRMQNDTKQCKLQTVPLSKYTEQSKRTTQPTPYTTSNQKAHTQLKSINNAHTEVLLRYNKCQVSKENTSGLHHKLNCSLNRPIAETTRHHTTNMHKSSTQTRL